MEYKDYYKTLGVERTASLDDIKRAYRKLARKYHPDVSKEPDAEERIKEVNEAYEVLKDPQKRAAYDQLGSQWKAGQEFRPPPGWDTAFEFRGGGFTGADTSRFSDFFESLFGDRGPFAGFGGAVRGGTFRMRGEDRLARVRIGLQDAFTGTTRVLELQTPEMDKEGRVTMRAHRIRVNIPAGITEGRHIRLAGQGEPGIGGGPNGDLYLEVEFEPHPIFHAENSDIYVNLPITPWEAALGAKVTVPTLGGKVEMSIPAGARTNQKLRLKGRGLPGPRPGDQYVVLQIVTPPADSEAARKLYKEMERTMPFNPRARLGV